MMINKGNLVALITIVLFFGYVIYMITRRKIIENEISVNGVYSVAIIKERHKDKFSAKDFSYYFHYKGKRLHDSDLADVEFSKTQKEGDTIIIKFLPSEPEKSMIIEDRVYKTCYGIPPKNGWKELPKCK